MTPAFVSELRAACPILVEICVLSTVSASRRACTKASFVLNSLLMPTLPHGTLVKKGPPSMWGKSRLMSGARRKSSRSSASLNCGSFVSSLVVTRTVRVSSGSACITTLRVVACFQSVVSSTHRMM